MLRLREFFLHGEFALFEGKFFCLGVELGLHELEFSLEFRGSELGFLLGHRAGFPLDMTRIRPEAMLTAMVESFHGRLEALRGEIGRLAA